MTTIELLERTKAAWGSIRSASAEEKNRLLLAMAESLEANSEDILRENAKDMEAAKGAISDVMLDRLALTESRIHAMAEGIREAAALPDHVGRALAQFKRPNGMTITKRQVGRRGAVHQERQRLHAAQRQGGLSLLSRHRHGAQGGR